jgi:hypothetical protein
MLPLRISVLNAVWKIVLIVLHLNYLQDFFNKFLGHINRESINYLEHGYWNTEDLRKTQCMHLRQSIKHQSMSYDVVKF